MPAAKQPIGIRAVQAVHEMNRKSGATVDQVAKRLGDAPSPTTIRRALLVGVRESRLMLCGDRYFPGVKGPKRTAKVTKKVAGPRVVAAKRRRSKSRRGSKKRASSRRRRSTKRAHRRGTPVPDHEQQDSLAAGPEVAVASANIETLEARRGSRRRSRKGRPRRNRSASRRRSGRSKRRSGKSKPRRRRSRRAEDDVDGRQVADQGQNQGQDQNS